MHNQMTSATQEHENPCTFNEITVQLSGSEVCGADQRLGTQKEKAQTSQEQLFKMWSPEMSSPPCIFADMKSSPCSEEEPCWFQQATCEKQRPGAT